MDMKHRATRRDAHDLWDRIQFPLERLHNLIASDKWSDGVSERRWLDKHELPYQVWPSNPLTTPQCALQSPMIRFPCPQCRKQCNFDATLFCQFRITKQGALRFPCCGESFTLDDLTAIHLRDDFKQFFDNKDPWYHSSFVFENSHRRQVKGLIFDTAKRDSAVDISADIDQFLQSENFHTLFYKRSSSWVEIERVFEATSRDISKRAGPRGHQIFNTIRLAYMGNVWSDLSVDLVAAATRQREFAIKITSFECNELDTPVGLKNACIRYHRFLRLLNSGQPEMRVPTLDIDLCWHTHQLVPFRYREWCVENLGRAIDHDDTIADGDLKAALRETSLAWLTAYGEPYTTEDLRKDYITAEKTLGGILFPPYGIYVWNKAKKLKQTRMSGDAAQRPVPYTSTSTVGNVQPYGSGMPDPRHSSAANEDRNWEAPMGPLGTML